MMTFGAANPRQCRSILHELFIQPEPFEYLLDQHDLIVVIVDIKLPRKALPQISQTVTVFAQQAHTEGVKRRYKRRVVILTR